MINRQKLRVSISFLRIILIPSIQDFVIVRNLHPLKMQAVEIFLSSPQQQVLPAAIPANPLPPPPPPIFDDDVLDAATLAAAKVNSKQYVIFILKLAHP